MRLIAAMVQDADADELLNALIEHGFRATRIETTGGFLRGSNSLILIGVPAQQVEDVLDVIRSHCHTRTQVVTPADAPFLNGAIEVEIGGAIVFVWEITRFERL